MEMKRLDNLLKIFLMTIKDSIFRKYIRSILLFCIGVFGCLAIMAMTKEASVSVSLNYENSEKNLSPNGSYLNIYSTFKNKDLLQRAIERTGLTGQLTASELDHMLGIRIQGLDRVKSNRPFVATSYIITLQGNKKLGNIQPEQMLDQLCCVYKEYFVELSGNLEPFFAFDITPLSNGDYLTETEILSLRASELKGFINDRIRETKNFTDSELGIRFIDLSGQLDEFINYDLEELSTYIIEQGLVEKKDDLLVELQYKRKLLQKEYDRSKAVYEANTRGIEMYDASMSAIVMIPSYDKDGEFFMHRTQNGVDQLSKAASYSLTDMNYYKAQLDALDYRCRRLRKFNNEPNKIEYVENRIEEMWELLNEISDKLYQVDRNYLQIKNRNSLTYRILETDYISFKKIILYGGCGIILPLLIALWETFRELKKGSRR